MYEEMTVAELEYEIRVLRAELRGDCHPEDRDSFMRELTICQQELGNAKRREAAAKCDRRRQRR